MQSQIAEETMEIEQSKEEIMRLLNNRASTQAKIQHFDTTQQQITTRRAQIHREILEVSSEAEQYGRELEQQRRGFEEITAEILEKHSTEIFDEAENRLHAQKAVLVKLLGRK